jgi:hypothetical protein
MWLLSWKKGEGNGELECIALRGRMEDELLGRQSAIAEARALYRMLGHGRNTVESLRELIAVPPKIERVLLAFAWAYPEEAYGIDRTLKFRQAVLEEFERLVREGVRVADLPEVEESEFDSPEETYAVAHA